MADNEVNLPFEAIEILKHAGMIAEQLRPEIIETLGHIATTGAGGPEEDWINQLADVADDITKTLESVYDAINNIPIAKVEPEEATELAQPDNELQEPVAEQPAASDQPAADAEPLEAPEQAVVSEEVSEPQESSPLDGLPISTNERVAANTIIALVNDTGERHNIQSIMKAAFGKRLQKAEQERLRAILDACSELGLLEKYGKTYGPGKLIFDTEEKVELTKHDYDLLEFMKSTLPQDGADAYFNIGQIVRQFFGVQELDSSSFEDFKDQINRLARLGYVIHDGGAWYKLGGLKPVVTMDSVEQPITTSALGFNANGAEAILKQATEDFKATQAAGPNKRSDAGLDELSEQILAHASNNDLVRIEEFHKEVPLLREMSKEEYKDFKANFPSIRQRIIDHLASQGIQASWEEEGRNRGKKYKLVINGQLYKSSKAIRSDKRQSRVPVSTPHEPAEPEIDQVIQTQPLTEREQRRQLRRAAHFTLKLAESVSDRLAGSPEHKEKMSIISKEIALTLGMGRPAARELVRQLVSAELIYFTESAGGHRYLSIDKPEQDFTPKRSKNGQESEKETGNLWRPEDLHLAVRVMDRLSQIRYVDQGIQTKDLARELGADEDVLKPLLRRMHSEGFMHYEYKARSTRGAKSRRTSIMVAKFKDQASKNHYRENREEVVGAIQALVNAGTQDPVMAQ